MYAQRNSKNTIASQYRELDQDTTLQRATFAGGCFWCMEPPFRELPGVMGVFSGYTGGEEADPGYWQVASGKTGHCEAVQVFFDPSRVEYSTLLETYWRHVDPTDAGGQFADRGPQYTTAVFYHSPAQQQAAMRSRQELEDSGRFDRPIVTPIESFTAFYPAELEHQDYARRHPLRYQLYARGSGRTGFLQKAWSDDQKE